MRVASTTSQARALLFLFGAMLLAGCSGRPFASIAKDSPAAVLTSPATAGIIDGRPRFREIFCALRNDHGATLPDDRPCEGDAALWRLADEPAAPNRPVALGPSTAKLRVVMVPGFLAECVAKTSKVFEDAAPYLETLGYATGYIQTRGRSSTPKNAALIREAILALPGEERLILVAHSKGVPDTLQALVDYPELTERVVAVIGVSGAVNGSPLVDTLPEALLSFINGFPLSACPTGQDAEAVHSLRRSERMAWLAAHPLPKNVRYYSLAAFAKRGDISAILKPFHSMLSGNDPLNDGLVLCSDAIIPGSTLLAYPNADHIAVAMPFTRKGKGLMGALINKNAYPREILLEAALKYVEEDLATASPSKPQ